MRPLTKFEDEHGYSPCPLDFGGKHCGAVPKPGSFCGGTYEECEAHGNLQRFAGVLVPGHAVGVLVLSNLPTVEVSYADEETRKTLHDAGVRRREWLRRKLFERGLP